MTADLLPKGHAALLSARADVTFRNDVSWFARFDGELAQGAHAYSGTGGEWGTSKYRIIESLALRAASGVWRRRHSLLLYWCIRS